MGRQHLWRMCPSSSSPAFVLPVPDQHDLEQAMLLSLFPLKLATTCSFHTSPQAGNKKQNKASIVRILQLTPA